MEKGYFFSGAIFFCDELLNFILIGHYKEGSVPI